MTESSSNPPSELTIEELNQAIEDAHEEMLTAWIEAVTAVEYTGYSLVDDVIAAAERGQVDAVRWMAARQRHSDLFEERRSRRRKEKGDA